MMGKNSKKRRIGSDDYTLDLEKRVLENERSLADLTKLFHEQMKEKDRKIAALELENSELRKGIDNGGLLVEKSVESGISDDVTDDDVTDHDLLVIGDSLVDSIDPKEVNANGGTTVVCVRGGSPKDILEAFRNQIKKKRFKRIVVHVGTNLIPIYHREYVADSIIETMFEIKKLSSESKIAFSCMLPKWNDSWLPDIDYINSRVANAGICVPPSRRFGFCNHLTRFVGMNGQVNPALFAKDGIHLSKSGSKLFNKSLKLLVDMD